MRRNLFFVGALALLAGCSSGTATPQINLPTAAQLRAVPVSLGISGKNLKGQTYVWRNMAPTVTLVGEPTPTQPMIVSFTVKAEDNTAVPGGLRAERITVTNGTDVWTSTELELQSDETSFGATVRNGPEWAIGTTVDVVVDFKNSTGDFYQLRAVGEVVKGAY